MITKKNRRRRRREKKRKHDETVQRTIIFFLFQQHRFKIALLDVPFVVVDELTSLFGSILSTIIDKQSRLDTADVG
jgi:hypothetical protein